MLHPLRLAAALSVAVFTAVAPAQPPTPGPLTDADVNRIVADYHAKTTAAAKAGQSIHKVIPSFADEAMAGTNPAALTITQLESLLGSAILRYTTRTAPILERLEALSSDRGPDGARAAVVHLSIIAAEPDGQKRFRVVESALTHPGLAEAIRAGKARDLFTAAQVLPQAEALAAAPFIADLAAILPDDLDPQPAWQTSYLVDLTMNPRAKVAPERLQALRAKALTIQEKALAKLGPAPASEPPDRAQSRNALTKNIEFLRGRYAQGTLLGHPAPDLQFLWSSADPPIRRLSDLKGKVVIIDFWATWCGPCRTSVPNLKALVEHYKDRPVVVLGVTSLQGRHIDAAGGQTDTKADPTKEFALMRPLMDAKGMTWPVVFSTRTVYDPDFGVRGIPHLAIIDASGVPRHRNLSPLMPLGMITPLIDPLLEEVVKAIPPQEGGIQVPSGSEEKK